MIVRRRALDAVVGQVLDQIVRLEASLAATTESLNARQATQAARHGEQLADLVAALDAVNRRVDTLSKTAAVQHTQSTSHFAQVIERLNDTTLAERVDAVRQQLEAETGSILSQLTGRLADEFGALAQNIQRLEAAAAGSSAQIAARLDNDLGNLADFTRRLDNDVANGFTQLADRLTAELLSLAQVMQNLDAAVAGGSAQIVARLDNDLGNLTSFTQRLDSDVGSGFVQLSERLTVDLAGLAQVIQNLDAAVASGSAQIAARLDDDLGNLANVSQRLDSDVGSGFAQLSDRLTADLARLAQVVQNLDAAVAGGSAQIAARLDNDLGNLVNFTRRLDNDVGSGFAQLSERLTADLAGLAQVIQNLDAAVAGGSAQIAARLDNDLGNLASFTQRLDSDVGSGFVQLSERLTADLAGLAQVIQNLDAAVASGSAQIAARLDADLGNLVSVSQRLDIDVGSGFAQLSDRLTADLAGLAQVTQNLDAAVAGGSAQIAARLDNDLGNLTSFTQRLDKDVGSGFVQLSERLTADLAGLAQAVQNVGSGFAQLSERLTADLSGLAQVVHNLDAAIVGGSAQIAARLDNDLGNLVGFTQRLDKDVVSGLAQLSERVTHDLGDVAALAQRLDRDVGSGFSQVSNRLEGDLVQLITRVHDVSAFMRFSSGTVAKLVLDQSDLAGRLRDLHRWLQKGSAASLSTVSDNPKRLSSIGDNALRPLFERAIPAELRAAVGDDGWDAEDLLRLPVTASMTEDALPSLLEIAAAARHKSGESRPLVWALSPNLTSLLSLEESNQIFGLLGQPERTRDIATAEGEWRLILGRTRPEGFAIALRWSLSAIEQLYFRLKPLFEEAVDRFGLHHAFHAIDLPEQESELDSWKTSVGELLNLLAEKDGAVFGIVLPSQFADQPALMSDAVAHLREALSRSASGLSLAFQWVRGGVPIALSPKIIEFAKRHAIPMDCTAVPRGSADGRLVAYQEFVPYLPLPFDIRLPSFGGAVADPFIMPRRSGREFVLASGGHDSELAGPGSLLDDEFDRSLRRLAPVLDRKARAQFEAQANLDSTLMPLWPEYFVFNWAVPPPAQLRLFEFDAAELVSGDSPLARLQRAGLLTGDKNPYVPASRFLDMARAIAHRPRASDAERRAKQVEEHAYQSERMEITADAKRLTNWIPALLGATLELGSGSGAMARAVGPRASTYVGLDLTTEQARLLRLLDASGLVGDLHDLPFADCSFDTVIADNVIEHAQDPVRALHEAHRVLRPSGSAFLVIPHDYFTSQFQNIAHLWKADEASARLAIESVGFVVARQQTVNLGELGVAGAYPSSGGMTGLWHLRKDATGSGEGARTGRRRKQ